jgi:orotidine-5'-phosphate decarboxylase
MIIGKLAKEIKNKSCPICVGLDTRLEYLPEEAVKNHASGTLSGACEAIYDFNRQLIDELTDIIPSVKIQNAYYEMYGLPGIEAYIKTIEYAHKAGLIVIADVKRGDIGSTSAAYASAHIGETPVVGGVPFGSDFMTVNPYFGTDGVRPFIKACEKNDKGLFVLVKTSNPTSAEIQDIKAEDNELIYEKVARLVMGWGETSIDPECGYNLVGAVVGATHKEQGIALRKMMRNTFFLIPGYGAQGAAAEDVAGMFDENGSGGIVNSSRGIICAWQKDETLSFRQAAKKATIAMKEDLNSAISAKISNS